MARPTVPLALEEYEARLAGLAAPRAYAVAVSGGRDSMALARLAAAHKASGRASVVALIVDHGLRPGARAEAERAAAWCEAAGLAAEILIWTGDKPRAGVQDAARQARYRLLAEAAQRARLGAILTAHTRDDQAETVFMRLARGAGPRGLRAMAAATRIAAGAGAPVALLRPFLDVERARLEATLAAAGQAFIDDPSNDDPAYERVRTRALLAALEEQGLLTHAALAAAAARAAETCAFEEARIAAAFRSAGGCFHRWGYASFSVPPAAVDPAMAGRVIQSVVGAAFAPGDDETRAFLTALGSAGAATLGGCIGVDADGLFYIAREPAAVLGRAGTAPLPPLVAAPGADALWDRRFRLRNATGQAEVLPLGADPKAARAAAALLGAPAPVVEAIPALRADDALRLPDSGELSAEPLAAEAFFSPVLRYH